MKKKSIIVLLAVCVLALTGCDSTDYKEAVSLYENGNYDKAKAMFVELGEYEDSATMVQACDYAKAVELYEAEDYDGAIAIFETISEYEDSSDYIDNAEYNRIIKSAGESCITSSWYLYIQDTWNNVDYYKSIYDFVAELREEVENNAFANELCKIYDELKLDEANDFVRDFIDFYIRQTCDAYTDVGFEFDEVTYLYKVGYDENGNVLNNSYDKKYTQYNRRIFVQIGEYTERYGAYNSYLYTDLEQMFYNIEIMEDWELGIKGDANSGVWNSQITNSPLNGAPYEKVGTDEIENILKKYDEFVSLIQVACENELKPYQEKKVNKANEEFREEQEARNAEPEIGMTKSEVLNGAWGEPDKKNIDEYEWGTHEQWVYDGKGYVYFEDGVVTSIQHR